MSGKGKKIIALCFLPAMVAGIIIYRDFFYYTRGRHSIEIQHQVIFWLTRLFLTPVLAWYILACKKAINEMFSLIIAQALGLAVYCLVCEFFNLAICRLPFLDFDGRTRNLINTIWLDSFAMNIVVYIVSTLILYSWFFFEQKNEFRGEISVMKNSLAGLSAKLTAMGRTKNAVLGEQACTFSVKNGSETILVPLEEIMYALSKGPYVKLATTGGMHLLYSRLYEVQAKFPPNFIRIHRSHIVNTAYIKGVRSLLNGDHLVILKNGLELKASRTYGKSLKLFLG